MADARRAPSAPWIVSAVAAAVLIAALIVYFVALRPDEGRVVGGLSSTERTAVDSAAQEVTNLLTFSRAHFDADFKRALNGTTGAMRADLQSKRSATLSAMTKGKFDLTATVTHKALEGPASKANSYLVLVTVNGFKSTAKDAPTPSDLEVTVARVKGKWLLSEITNIGVS
jgi:Mce-associated membrane protein